VTSASLLRKAGFYFRLYDSLSGWRIHNAGRRLKSIAKPALIILVFLADVYEQPPRYSPAGPDANRSIANLRHQVKSGDVAAVNMFRGVMANGLETLMGATSTSTIRVQRGGRIFRKASAVMTSARAGNSRSRRAVWSSVSRSAQQSAITASR
jgi:hypothetical protein